MVRSKHEIWKRFSNPFLSVSLGDVVGSPLGLPTVARKAYFTPHGDGHVWCYYMIFSTIVR